MTKSSAGSKFAWRNMAEAEHRDLLKQALMDEHRAKMSREEGFRRARMVTADEKLVKEAQRRPTCVDHVVLLEGLAHEAGLDAANGPGVSLAPRILALRRAAAT